MKHLINKILNKLGYQIKRVDNGFSFVSNLDWLKQMNINTILDIGANEGQFAKFINNLIPNCKIYSFEPIKNCFLKLVELQHQIDCLIPLNYGIGDKNDIVDFYVNQFTPSSSFLKMENEHVENFSFTEKYTIEKLELKTLDNIYEDLLIDNNVLVKIDVQGFEEKVINGGMNFFKKIPKIVIVEASIVKLYENEAPFEILYDLFRNLGFYYKGNMNQLYSPIDGKILQVDAIFVKP